MPARADLCRSRAMLEGSCPAQTCRPRRLKMTGWVTRVLAAKASDSVDYDKRTIAPHSRRTRQAPPRQLDGSTAAHPVQPAIASSDVDLPVQPRGLFGPERGRPYLRRPNLRRLVLSWLTGTRSPKRVTMYGPSSGSSCCSSGRNSSESSADGVFSSPTTGANARAASRDRDPDVDGDMLPCRSRIDLDVDPRGAHGVRVLFRRSDCFGRINFIRRRFHGASSLSGYPGFTDPGHRGALVLGDFGRVNAAAGSLRSRPNPEIQRVAVLGLPIDSCSILIGTSAGRPRPTSASKRRPREPAIGLSS